MSNIRLAPNDFNIGKDISGFLADDAGNVRQFADIGHMLELRLEIEDRLIEVIPITGGGVPLKETIWRGGILHLRYTRARGNLEYMALTAMQNFFFRDARPNFSATYFITNKDGSIDRVVFIGGKITRPDLGRFSGEKDVEQGISLSFTQGRIFGPNAPILGASPLSFI